jgi:PE family
MSLVTAAPELITAAAADIANIGSTINAAHIAAATPTAAVIPAAADEVSSSIAHLFSQHAQDYQALAGQAAAFHDQFVQHLTSSAGSYASAEATNAAALLQPLAAGASSVAAASSLVDNAVTNLYDIIGTALTIIAIPLLGIALLPLLGLVVTAIGIAAVLFALVLGAALLGPLFSAIAGIL